MQGAVIFAQSRPSQVVASNVRLLPGDSAIIPVVARIPQNHTKIEVVQGASYSFLVPEGERWTDWLIKVGPLGYAHGPLVFIQESFRFRKPLPDQNWFALTGSVSGSDDHLFLIGGRLKPIPMQASGELILFANDAKGFYWNNFGTIHVVVTRVT